MEGPRPIADPADNDGSTPTSGIEFFTLVQKKRVDRGLPREAPPKNPERRAVFDERLKYWWSDVEAEPNGPTRALQAYDNGYLDDAYWGPKSWPFAGFITQWRDHLPKFTPPPPPGPTLPGAWSTAIAGITNRYVACRLRDGDEGELLERDGALVIVARDNWAADRLREQLPELGLDVVVEVAA